MMESRNPPPAPSPTEHKVTGVGRGCGVGRWVKVSRYCQMSLQASHGSPPPRTAPPGTRRPRHYTIGHALHGRRRGNTDLLCQIVTR
ncbi:hypothetical protein E2C01_072095 [Portunus trituberculatus]|uniref:Uncharacterized protein n=1 Tax=Portunus trituberculatus TaxID=210409 RepID=A0A5B7I816_PORTR|nr:hypothetical protein [Portunus trituberculatus]